MASYKLLVEYDGSRFAGWQVQPRGRTVQGALLTALRDATGQGELDLQGAGRTDAGVHALGQVASLRCRQPLDTVAVARTLDRALPADIAVLKLEPAVAGFHARHDATARSYRYQISLRRSAFGKRTSWWVAERLDLERMAQAAKAFVGRHDFRALMKRAGEADSTLVEVEACTVATAGDVVLVRIVASHFLWNQVRRMVGALVEVGRGNARTGDVRRWLDGSAAPPLLAAPAAGLYLEAVRYPRESFELPPLLPVGLPLSPAVLG